MIELKEILEVLRKKRPLFHSEADFQHALAWEIHKKYPKSEIRLERPMTINENKTYHIDIYNRLNSDIIPIELKYKTAPLNKKINDEIFQLKNQLAYPPNEYAFLKDIERIEEIIELLKKKNRISYGFVVFLTNDKRYWEGSKEEEPVDKEFLIYEGRAISSTLRWSVKTQGAKKGKEAPIVLKGNYIIKWNNYSNLENVKNGNFRYIILNINL